LELSSSYCKNPPSPSWNGKNFTIYCEESRSGSVWICQAIGLYLNSNDLPAIHATAKRLTWLMTCFHLLFCTAAYARDKSSFGFISSLFNVVKGLAILWYSWYPSLWEYSGTFLEMCGLDTTYEVWRLSLPFFQLVIWIMFFSSFLLFHFQKVTQSLVFVLSLSLFDVVTSLPFSLYSTFVIEQKVR